MVGIIVHGGAGTIPDEERRKLAAEGVDLAADIGYQILTEGGSAVEAVKMAVAKMEDIHPFNAGYGSVLTEDFTVEMDAMIVEGHTGNMGGVMNISRIKNPILLCETIMYESKHLLFTREGAERFAESHGYELIDPKTLISDRIRERYKRWSEKKGSDKVDPEGRDKYGTVGAVAIDKEGHLAAATSTGGTMGKQLGRVGDTPIFGAGTYADLDIAISATGVGEYIIQGMVGMRIAHLREYHDIEKATKLALQYVHERFGPLGVICIETTGAWTAQKTTKDLVFAFKNETGFGNFLD